MGLGHIQTLTLASLCALGCTQVHQLGQAGDSADTAESPASSSDSSADSTVTSSASTEGSGDSEGDTTGDSTAVSGDSEDSGDETHGEESEETGETDGPTPDPCAVMDLGGNPGLTIEITLMTEWDEGACHEFRVTNETLDDVIWTRDLRFGGELDNYWNAEAEELAPTDWRFGGQASAGNIVILSRQTVLFGGCMQCVP